jgi:hypothetical protein
MEITQVLSPNPWGFSLYHSTDALYSPSACCSYQDKRAGPENIPKAMLILKERRKFFRRNKVTKILIHTNIFPINPHRCF